MPSKRKNPSWWLLYLLVALVMGVFLLEMRMHLSSIEHKVLEIAILIVLYGLVILWLNGNSVAFIREEWNEQHASGRRLSASITIWRTISCWLAAIGSAISDHFRS